MPGLVYHIHQTHFNPLSPHGERPCGGTGGSPDPQDFNPLSPHGERLKALREITTRRDMISIHSPRMGRDRKFSNPEQRWKEFQSTLPAWGETALISCGNITVDGISIHSPRMGRDPPPAGPAPVAQRHFNPLSPHGERPLDAPAVAPRRRFQSTLPAWGETAVQAFHFLPPRNFNPLSPHGERRIPCAWIGATFHFNPLSPHGERLNHPQKFSIWLLFQSTLPAWGETGIANLIKEKGKFQSTLPAWGETPRPNRKGFHRAHFNPLSPHGERLCDGLRYRRSHLFQSTLPAWGETGTEPAERDSPPISIHSPRMGRDLQRILKHQRRVRISIHSPRMGRDVRLPTSCAGWRNFNPLSPHGERLLAQMDLQCARQFQSTLPAWGETGSPCTVAYGVGISIHSPRMGRDVKGYAEELGMTISIHSPRMGRDVIRNHR